MSSDSVHSLKTDRQAFGLVSRLARLVIVVVLGACRVRVLLLWLRLFARAQHPLRFLVRWAPNTSVCTLQS